MNRYDSYKNSGVEWIGEIPSSWNLISIKHLVSTKITDGPHETPTWVDKGIPFLSVESVQNNKLYFERKRGYITKELHEEYSKKCKPQRDDIFIVKSGSTTGKSTIVETDEEFNIWSPLCIVRPDKKKVLPKFIFSSIQSFYFRRFVELGWSFGTQPNIGMGVIENIKLVIPSLSEQKKIVSFLDTKTSLIDSLIEKTQRKIKLLKEKRSSIINEVVTKGLNPNVEMKDSGVEWIGETPSNWLKTKVKYISDVVRGSILRPVDEPLYFDDNGDWTYLNISDVTKVEKYLDKGKLRLSELGSTKSRRVEPNNLIITGSGTVGKVFINNIPVCVHDGFIPLLNLKVNIDFMFYYLINPNLYVGIGKTNSQKNIYLDEVKEMDISVPSNSEQQQIVDYLDEQTQLIDKTISIEEKRTELLKEYRQSLISELVTGKRKVV